MTRPLFWHPLSVAQEIEEVYVAGDEDTTLSGIVEDRAVIEMTVQGTEGLGPASNRSMKHGIIVGVCRHYARSWPRKNQFR